MNDLYIWGIVAAIALAPAALRVAPFILFGNGRKTPKIIEKLGHSLPFAVMGMLVVYCLKEIRFTSVSAFLPTLLSCLVTVGLYVWRRNTLFSILCGTVCHMILLQFVF